jgi:hypothetical protein
VKIYCQIKGKFVPVSELVDEALGPGAYAQVTFAILWMSCVLTAIGLALIGRFAAARRSTRHDGSMRRPVIVLASVAALLTLAISAASFAFMHDDYTYLVQAVTDPWRADAQLRLVGVQIPFWIAVQSRVPALLLALMDVAAAAGCSLALAAMLSGGGWSRAEASLAALLFVASDPIVRLTVWGAGLQQIFAWSLIFLILHAVRSATHDPDPRRRWGWILVALGLAGPAAMCKWQVAWIAIPGAWFWAQGSTLSPRSRRMGWTLPVGVAVAMALPLFLTGINRGAASAGVGHLARNLSAAADGFLRMIATVLVALAVATALQSGLRSMPNRLRELLGEQSRRIGRALALAVLFITPFLFHVGDSFAEYYFGPAIAWLSAAAAPLLLSAAPPGRRAWAVAGVIILLWLPQDAWWQVAASDSAGHRVGAWLAEVRTALAELPPTDTIVIDAGCSSKTATDESRLQLEQLFALSERGDGVRWVTGWFDAAVTVGPDAGAGTCLAFCESSAPRVRVEPAACRRIGGQQAS